MSLEMSGKDPNSSFIDKETVLPPKIKKKKQKKKKMKTKNTQIYNKE